MLTDPTDKAACYGYRMTASELVAFLRDEADNAAERDGSRAAGLTQAYEFIERAIVAAAAPEAKHLDPASDEARAEGCTCRLIPPDKWGDDPEPTVRRDEWCPLHGADPDEAMEKLRDDQARGWR